MLKERDSLPFIQGNPHSNPTQKENKLKTQGNRKKKRRDKDRTKCIRSWNHAPQYKTITNKALTQRSTSRFDVALKRKSFSLATRPNSLRYITCTTNFLSFSNFFEIFLMSRANSLAPLVSIIWLIKCLLASFPWIVKRPSGKLLSQSTSRWLSSKQTYNNCPEQ